MLQNYLKIALRNLRRQKAFTAINVVGLAIGLATCIVMMLYVRDELSYDRYHEKADRIVRVVTRGMMGDQSLNMSFVGPPVARDLKREFPEILAAVRLRDYGSQFISYGTNSFKEESFFGADSTFFQLFSIPVRKGNPDKALSAPNAIVLTETTARKYFGAQDPIGKVLLLGQEKEPLQVTAVMADVPANSHFHFNALISLNGSKEAGGQEWLNNANFNTYLLLPEQYDYRKLEAKLHGVTEKYVGQDLKKFMGITLKQFREAGNEFGLGLQPLTDIHLHSGPVQGLEPNGDIRNVYVLTAIALFMLLIACVNFMNLSTATASGRAREVGVRKVLGSVRGQLQLQFLVESVLLAVVALGLALMLVQGSLPVFNQLTEKALSLAVGSNPLLGPGLLAGAVGVGLLAGSYPAFYLSSFRPVAVLKGRVVGGRSGVTLRSGLVVFQFFISITLIIATVVAFRQHRFLFSREMGFERDQVLVIQDSYMLGRNEAVLREKLLQNPRVSRISVSGFVPVGPTFNNNSSLSPKDDPNKGIVTRLFNVDVDYIPTLGMRLVQGRNFSTDFPTDSSAVILNETGARAYGWPKQAVGKEILRIVDEKGTKQAFRVIGVVKDFHFESLRQRIGPLMMFLGGNTGSLLVKLKAGNVAEVLPSIKREWEALSPAAPFRYSFLDERFEQSFRQEQKTSEVLTLFAGLTVFIACLGLFGLATYTAEQRRKEIGVRKVLGASVSGIVALLSGEFLKLVGIAIALAVPLAWFAMSRWLNDFAYKVPLDWWVFALAGAVAILIALITVSFQSIRAALTNPVQSLRSE
ncbi:ABC transporter permease [Larkinella soli]|uniref:ABC transporter permease n=1 Tax=Larkinella soli TaxID=1770527 RepID=UPI000FFC16A9|nr:ABC transporter permease [Larkinella soli]